MKDLDDLLPDKSLIPPPAEEEPPPGTRTIVYFYTSINAILTLHINQVDPLALNFLNLLYFLSQRSYRRRAASRPKWSLVRQGKVSMCKRRCHWLPQTPEGLWPVPQGQEGGLLSTPEAPMLCLAEAEDRVHLQEDKTTPDCHTVKRDVSFIYLRKSFF